ncbi:MAG: ACT domain-containing protein [Candidatus Bathyarchaeota archaeon]|nr:ACT domain-containing protein [Candidatus Termiticorpusculum sp.]
MKVLLNDGLETQGLEVFQKAGIETDTRKRDLNGLIAEIGQFDALVVRSATKVTREIIEAGAKGNLKIIGRAGVGYDNIDVVAASENGVVVKIAPFGSTNAVAELAITLMLSISRNTSQSHYSLKNGVWIKKKFEGTELAHKTLGVIGCGRIGQKLAQIAKRGFDMEIIGYDICPNSEIRMKFVSKEELLKQADYISIHTGGKDIIIGEKELTQMKPKAFIINTSRGNNIDQIALYNALKEKKIGGYATDVYKEEPKTECESFNDPLKELDNVVLSSHLGASTVEAQVETSTEIACVLSNYLKSGDFTNAVNASANIAVEEKQIYNLFIHHKDIPGVFASIDKVLADNNINIRANYSRQINTGYAISVYALHQKATPEIITQLKTIPNICNVKH